MITVLRKIKGHNKVETLQIMLEVIEILEKNIALDDTINSDDWIVIFPFLEKYYCELKELFIKERGF